MDQETAKLWDVFRVSRTKDIRDQLVLKYMPLVKYVLGRVAIYLPPSLDEDDLAAVGVIGLLRAIGDFDFERKTEFTTFAVPRIRGAVLDELRAQDWIPRSARKKASLIMQAYNRLWEKEDRPPTLDEVAMAMGMSPGEFDRALAEVTFASFVSLETISDNGHDEELRLLETMESRDARTPLGIIESEEEAELLGRAIGDLPYQERVVITMYYYHDLMLKEIAKILRVSKSRVSQIHNKALLTLRLRMRTLSLQGSETWNVPAMASTH